MMKLFIGYEIQHLHTYDGENWEDCLNALKSDERGQHRKEEWWNCGALVPPILCQQFGCLSL